MKLIFLGTGSAFTDFRYNYYNNAVLDFGKNVGGKGRYLLIDCGDTAVQSLKELNIPLSEVIGVLITHIHGDHVNGLERLIWERYYSSGPNNTPAWLKTDIYFPSKKIKQGVRDILKHSLGEWTDHLGTSRTEGYKYLVKEYNCSPDFYFDEYSFEFHPVDHVDLKDSYGLIIANDKEDFVFYTSDTRFTFKANEQTYTHYKNLPFAELIFHDCTFSPYYPGTVHTHYSELLTLSDADKKRTVLMHYTKIPDGIDIEKDGFLCAAKKHQVFDIL